ncbi:DUF1659 domain-containing protein [Tissierella praeacuta]|uniref:DUF1659 domain-containing protein n=1 Tax=Tissierella praeacuta TaxID=43131 RepID=UPI001C0F856A|nr:DUF1659 domain-containing protein [Tissierella praeacuta]MBU5255572.1 DUF1659 domain-containing protein [Tissierella praeacuta]
MAMENVKEKLSLKLEIDGGMVNGKQKTLSKTFSQIKTTADDTNLYTAATAIANLQEKSLLKVQKVETTTLINE